MGGSFPEQSATTRVELQCPECFTRGLVPGKTTDAFDSRRNRLAHCSECPNPECEVETVPAEAVEAQLASGWLALHPLADWLPSRRVAAVVGVCLLGVIALLVAVVGGFGGLAGPVGGQQAVPPAGDSAGASVGETPTMTPAPTPTATPSNASELEKSPTSGVRTHEADGPWTIYEHGGQFLIGALQNGTPVFLTANGSVITEPRYLNSLTASRAAVRAWAQSSESLQLDRLPATAADSWAVFTRGGESVIAGRIDDEVAFLNSAGTASSTPYSYTNYSEISQALLSWHVAQAADTGSNMAVTSVSMATVREALTAWAETTSTPAGDERTATDTEQTVTLSSRNTSQEDSSQAVSGTVYNQHGEPVEGATVHLHSDPRTTTTGPDGHYRFEDVPAGSHDLFVEPPSGSNLTVSQPVTFGLSTAGRMQIERAPQSAVYFETTDGAVAQNRVQIVLQRAQPIRFAGSGSAMAATLKFQQVANAQNVSVQLWGTYTETVHTERVSGSGGTLQIEGDTPPQNQSLTLIGQVTSANRTAAGTYTGTDPTVEIDGNLAPRNLSVTLTGRQTATRHTSIGQLQWAEARLTGDQAATSVWAGEGTRIRTSQTIYQAPVSGTYEITVPWSTRVDDGEYASVRVETCSTTGCDVVGQVTHESGTATWGSKRLGTITDRVSLESGERVVATIVADDYGRSSLRSKDEAVSYASGNPPKQLSFEPQGSAPPTNATLNVSVPDGPVATWQTPYLYKTGEFTRWGGASSNRGTVTLFTASEAGMYRLSVPVTLTAVSTHVYGSVWYHGQADLWFETSDGTELAHEHLDALDCGNCDREKTTTVTATTHLDAGESIIIRYDMYGPSTATLDEAPAGVGRLAQPPGKVTVTADGTTHDLGTLARGESASVHLSNLTADSEIAVQAANREGDLRALDYHLAWTDHNVTRDPQLRLDGQTVCGQTGQLNGSLTCDLPRSEFGPGNHTLNLSTSAGGVDYSVTYQARALPTAATVIVDGQTYAYGEDFPGSGPLGRTAQRGATTQIATLDRGSNQFGLSSAPVDGIQTNVTASLSYEGAGAQTTAPTVTVLAPNGTTHTATVPTAALEDGKLYGTHTLSLPAAWFGTGENVVTVRTADGSQVQATVTASGLRYQAGTLSTTSQTNTTTGGG